MIGDRYKRPQIERDQSSLAGFVDNTFITGVNENNAQKKISLDKISTNLHQSRT